MDEITVVVEDSDWLATFLAQLLATIAGAVIALAGSWLLFRAESRARGASELDTAIGRALDECVLYLRAITPFVADARQCVPFADAKSARISSAGIEAALRGAVVVADGTARKALYMLVQIAATIEIGRRAEFREGLAEEVREILYEWKGARRISDEQALQRAAEFRNTLPSTAAPETSL